ncbi:hypothetical protein [Natronorubrum daqingense]|uniref:Uncharacterized protein n=1 Tax=Natronorubrum daqingense TaxID=588898 RepID=A0A1N7G1V5_9EURY|nr:hypothetical protein [Natronorubrum daqingense]APX98641.1 hypothetical protein BB347_18290 [Natronorubrum daqingense]SIS06557.1 hypothetical protein SAMN05421809_3675 [Natronorubrum daqingense]
MTDRGRDQNSSDHPSGLDDPQETAARVQRRVAAVNTTASRAVDESINLTDTQYPSSSLSNTQSELCKLMGQTREALSQTERAITATDSEYGEPTPRQITDEHADRLRETYDGPLQNLALMLLGFNRRKWLYEQPETRGAEEVERHGLTSNQREWLNDLQDAWRAYDGE